jgi:hypothetical protein
MSGTRSRATVQVGTRSRLVRGSTSDVHVWRTASDGRCTPARPALHLWNASVNVLRRTRRNAHTIGGAAPDVEPSDVLPRIARERVPPIARLPRLMISSSPEASSPKRCLYDRAAAPIQDRRIQLKIILDSSGTRRLRRKIPLLFGEESLKTVCFDSFILKQALKTDAERLFKSFLARNELVASVFA